VFFIFIFLGNNKNRHISNRLKPAVAVFTYHQVFNIVFLLKQNGDMKKSALLKQNSFDEGSYFFVAN